MIVTITDEATYMMIALFIFAFFPYLHLFLIFMIMSIVELIDYILHLIHRFKLKDWLLMSSALH